jgi:predicted helicase
MDDTARRFWGRIAQAGVRRVGNQGVANRLQSACLSCRRRYVSRAFGVDPDSNNEIKLEDAVKITGCWNGLQKRLLGSEAMATRSQ